MLGIARALERPFYYSYGGEETGSISFKALDPIKDPGCLVLEGLERMAPFAAQAIETLGQVDLFDLTADAALLPSIAPVRKPYLRHLSQLANWGVAEKVEPHLVEEVLKGGYFAVRKTDESSRSIYDGRRTSASCQKPWVAFT
jgi:hypothetical protein